MRSSDIPLWLQVFWKLLCAFMVAILVYAALGTKPLEGRIVVFVSAVAIGLVGLFTQLGDES